MISASGSSARIIGRSARRAEDHRLLAAARVQQPIGEDMAALGVGAELRLVERDEGDVARPSGIDFGGAQEPARVLRHDLLLAGDQRDLVRALDRDDPVVDLARQQPQREADHAAANGRTSARPRDGSCRCWSARARRLGRRWRTRHGRKIVVRRPAQSATLARRVRTRDSAWRPRDVASPHATPDTWPS